MSVELWELAMIWSGHWEDVELARGSHLVLRGRRTHPEPGIADVVMISNPGVVSQVVQPYLGGFESMLGERPEILGTDYD